MASVIKFPKLHSDVLQTLLSPSSNTFVLPTTVFFIASTAGLQLSNSAKTSLA